VIDEKQSTENLKVKLLLVSDSEKKVIKWLI